MTRVVAYLRQSDEEGYKKELSIPAQRDRFLADVARRVEAGEDVTYEFAPADEGKSGGELDRPGLQWLLSNLDRFDEVWVYDHDRLVRHDFYAPLIMRELRTRGVKLWCSTGGSDEETPMGRFMTDLRFRFGALYREQVSERTKMNRDHRLKEGLWSGHPPTGYMFTDENGPGTRRLLVPDPDNAPRVKALFGMLACGESQRKACALMGTTQTTVIWQRDNPLYIGLVYKHRANVEALPVRTHAALWTLAQDETVTWLYPGRHQPLIDAATWDALELRRQASPKSKMSKTHGLSGRFRCASCGGVIRIATNQGKRHPSLRCDRCKWERSYRYGENAVLAALAILTDSPEFEQAVEDELRKRETPPEDTRLAALISERTKVSKQLERALDVILAGDELADALRERAVGLRTRREELDRQIDQAKAAIASRPSTVVSWRLTKKQLVSRPIAEVWGKATPQEQRDLLMQVFSRITVTPVRLTFVVRGLDMAFELPWLRRYVHSPQVAGPRRERMVDICDGYRFLGEVA